MTRPLMQHGVAQLEQLFASSKLDQKVLKQLENELRFRQVPRAVSLLAEVQAVLVSTSPLGADRAPAAASANSPMADGPELLRPAPKQPGLWSVPPATDTAPAPAPAPAAPVIKADPNTTKTEPAPVAKSSGSGAFEVTLSDAYKMFKATPSSTWESIEKLRRQLVQACSPSRTRNLPLREQKDLLEQARRLNAAYEVLSRSRGVA